MAEQNQENSSEGIVFSEESLLQLINHCKSISAGGGGGNRNFYGYTSPPEIESSNNGDVYYYLDSTNNRKIGLWLKMNNDWVLIDGKLSKMVLYDHGEEGVLFHLVNATKESEYINVETGSGIYSNYAITVDPIDVTGYSNLHVECYYRGQSYTRDFDITGVIGEKYISFTYLTDESHNECAIGFADTKTSAVTYRIDSRNGGDALQRLYSLVLS